MKDFGVIIINHNYKIQENRVSLLPMTVEDSEKYRVIRNRPNVRKWFFSKIEINQNQQKQWFERYLNDNSSIMFSVYYEKSFVGAVGIYNIDYKEKVAEVGRIVIDKEKTYPIMVGTQTIKLVCKIAKEIGLEGLYAEILVDNDASKNAFDKAGFILDNSLYKDKVIAKINLRIV